MERYESLGLVGEGSYGAVLKCRHRDSGRLVAIKKFVDSDEDKTVKKIAQREVRLLRQLRHGNLVNLLEAWKRRRRWYLVFEFVERTLLDDLEQNPGGLDPDTCRRNLFQILRAAAFCHQQKIIHRDIKPENVLISQGGVVKLCDFGFARTLASPAEGDVYTDYVATRWYRAPELLVGDRKYGKPVDVWAVGCLSLEMWTGQPLFPGDSDLDQIHLIVRTFGNLTTRHQELFRTNPVFSGVKLPECRSQVALQQRFPALTSAALHLAQSCLHMDPERRAHCSDLMDHQLFTRDSFNVRFLDELTAKIQKDRSQNSALPKITKTPRPERDQGKEKTKKGKERKRLEDLAEKVNKDKEKKNKKEEKVRILKTPRNISEPFSNNKQSKTVTGKVPAVNAGRAVKGEEGTLPGGRLKKVLEDSDGSKTGGTRTQADLTGDNSTEPHSRGGASPEPRHSFIKTTDQETCGLSPPVSGEKNVTDLCLLSRSVAGPDLENSWTHTHLKARSSSSSSLKSSTAHRTDPSFTLQVFGPSGRDHVPAVLMPRTCSPSSEHPSKQLFAESQQTSEPSKVFPSSSKSSKRTSISGPESNKASESASLSKSQVSGVSSQSFAVSSEATPSHHPATLHVPCANQTLYKTGLSSVLNLPKDGGPVQASGTIRTQQGHFKPEIRNFLKPSPERRETNVTPRPTHPEGDHQEDPGSPELWRVHRHSICPPDMVSESRMPSNHTLSDTPEENSPGTRFPKASDKENREEIVFSVSVTPATRSLVAQTSKVPGTWSPRQKQRSGEVDAHFGTRQRGDDSQRKSTVMDSKLVQKSLIPDQHQLSPPPPPPPPSSTPLFNIPALREHPNPVLQTGPISTRCVNKTKPPAPVCNRRARPTLSLTSKVPERSVTSECSFLSDRCNLSVTRKKSDVHFPDLSGSSHPEIRGRDVFPGKQQRGVGTETRNHRGPVPSERRRQRNQRRHTP